MLTNQEKLKSYTNPELNKNSHIVNVTCWYDNIIRKLTIGLCLRRKHILVIGTNRSKILRYIREQFKVPSSPTTFVHSNVDCYITERKIETLTLHDLLVDLNNPEYDEVLFYSTHRNVCLLNKLSMNEKLKSKLKLVSYIE